MLTKFLTKLNWAVKAFNSACPTQVAIGQGIVLDLVSNRIVIQGDFELYTKGHLRLRSDKHVIINSGRDEEQRPGYIHAIWLNSDEDDFGRPILADDTEIEAIKDGSIKHT